MEAVKAVGAHTIAYLQQTDLAWYAFPLHRMLWYCSPTFVLTVLTPLLLAVQGVRYGRLTVSPSLALAVLWTALVSLRLNVLKQWALGEDRPFWWVKETPLYTSERAPDLLQYPVTCLSSPSAPSHSLLAAGVGLVLLRGALHLIRQAHLSSERRERLAVAGAWLSYVTFVSLVCLADCFFSQHFPHQVALAAGIGLCIGLMMLESDLTSGGSVGRTVLTNLVILALTLAVMYKKEAVGTFNEFQRSSFKWCQKREWMQLDPAPLTDAFVFTGFAVGAALATASKYFARLNKQKFTVGMVVSLAVLNAGACQSVLLLPEAIALVTKHVYVTYVGQLVTSALVPLCCVALVPYFVQVASGLQPAKAKKL